jgi:hypothetical protein
MSTYRIVRASPPRFEWIVVPTSPDDGTPIQVFKEEADAQAVADRLNAVEARLEDCT